MSGERAESGRATPQRPRRDTSARTRVGECDYCGGNADSALGGEHIWKCSEVVPKDLLAELAKEWEKQRTGDEKTDEAFERAAERLREVAGLE